MRHIKVNQYFIILSFPFVLYALIFQECMIIITIHFTLQYVKFIRVADSSSV